ncbi:hypothetical protein Tco_1211402 [Tanacetum coccineum]
MAEPNDYITATRKKFVSNDNEGRMVKKCIVEIQGTFLVKIHDDTFNGNVGENAFKHIDKFLKIVGPIKINGLTQDRFRLSIFPVSVAGAASEWVTKECIGLITTWVNMVEKFIMKFHHLSDHNEETKEDDNPNETDNALEIFKIKGNLFDFETPLCEAFHKFKCLLKIDTDMFTYDIQNFKTYDEYKRELNNDKAKGTEEPWWYNELAIGKLKDETLALKDKIEGSWGDSTLRVIKFCRWLKSCFENIQELEYELLNQGHEEQKGNPNPEPSNCKVRRFEMMKYSFNDDEEYITIKESEYLRHYRELLLLINEGWVVTTPED